MIPENDWRYYPQLNISCDECEERFIVSFIVPGPASITVRCTYCGQVNQCDYPPLSTAWQKEEIARTNARNDAIEVFIEKYLGWLLDYFRYP